MLLYIIIAVVCCCKPAFAQKENNVWTFATRCGLDFNSGNPVIMLSGINTLEGCATVSDVNTGSLLFYTDGNRVYNRNHAIMPSGILFTTDIVGITTSTTQAAAIASVPGKYGQYYLFSLESGPTKNAHLYYSIIDMRLNDGLGGIIPGKKAILLDSGIAEKMAVVKGNNCDIWLMLRSITRHEYKAYNITNTGISPTSVISNIGFNIPYSYGIGEIMFTHNWEKMVAASSIVNGIELYDFDANTGVLSNTIEIIANGYGVAFSPDDSKLYAVDENRSEILQFDLSTPTYLAINNSKSVVATIPRSSYPPLSPGLWNIKLAGNGKMYFGAAQQMSVINQPNLLGAACSPAYNVITFPAGMSQYLGLPNPPAALPQRSSFTRQNGCAKNDVTIQAKANGINYLWDDSVAGSTRTVTQSGYYAVTYQVGCAAYIDSFYVDIPDEFPQTTATASCANAANGMLEIHNTANDNASYTYTWMDSNGDVLRTATSNTGDTLTDLYPGSYKVRVTYISCDSIVALLVPDLPTPSVSFTATDNACINQPIQFTNTSISTNSTWLFGDNTENNVDYNPRHSYKKTGSYTVILYASGENGCTDTATQVIDVHELNLLLTTSDMVLNRGETITLRTNSFENYSVTSWLPAYLFDNQSAKEQSIVIDTNTIVTVIGQSDMGCIDTAMVNITVKPKYFLPSSFTPNGDGLNDIFRLQIPNGISTASISLQIYDRWGKEVWKGDNATAYTGWDGSYKGQPAGIGTYWYLLQIRPLNMETIIQKGDVILIR